MLEMNILDLAVNLATGATHILRYREVQLLDCRCALPLTGIMLQEKTCF